MIGLNLKTIGRTLIYALNTIMPKNRNKMLFRAGFKYPDNIAAIIDQLLGTTEVNKYHIFYAGPGYEKYIGDNRVKILKNKVIEFLHYLTSRYVIFETGMYLNSQPVKNQITVNTWHGISLKKIGFYLNPDERRHQTSTYFSTYSDFFKPCVEHAFGIPKKNILITGEPRNDFLFTPLSSEQIARIDNRLLGKQIILWMPTYRQSKFESKSDGAVYEFGFPCVNSTNISIINDICSECNITLVMKWHGLQVLPKELISKYSNIVFLTSDYLGEQKIPMYALLGMSDALITDYSSVYINYLVLDRPICFVYDDMQTYEHNRGFMFDNVREIMPGAHCNNIEQICSFIKSIHDKDDTYQIERSEVCKKLNKYTDNQNAYRLLKSIGLIEGEQK